jgi:hypothetical protein
MPDDASTSPTDPDPEGQPTVAMPARPAADAAHQPGDVIGHYKVLEILGEGGFGVVYLAEQTEPVRRRVALKIIKPCMNSKAFVVRLDAERQPSAIMSHPNVAKVLDAGPTPMDSRGVGHRKGVGCRHMGKLGRAERPHERGVLQRVQPGGDVDRHGAMGQHRAVAVRRQAKVC